MEDRLKEKIQKAINVVDETLIDLQYYLDHLEEQNKYVDIIKQSDLEKFNNNLPAHMEAVIEHSLLINNEIHLVVYIRECPMYVEEENTTLKITQINIFE